MSVDMSLVSSGGGWMGTFGIVITAAVSDILSDGEPFTAYLEWEDDNGDLETRTVQIESVDPGAYTLTTTSKCVVPIDAIRKLEA